MKATLLAGLAGLLAGRATAQPPPGEHPNVILIVADDLGYGDVGFLSSPDARTPHLDSLAARGLRLTDFYAGGPVCTPSRHALLTGLHTFRAGDPHLLQAVAPGNTTSGIGGRTYTLAEALQAEGYETALIGKWHLGHGEMFEGGSDTEFHPLHHGFDAFFGLLSVIVDYNTHWYQGDYLDWWEDRRPVPEDSLRYATHVFGDRTVAFLDEHAGAPVRRRPRSFSTSL
jgi:arylsulfatase A-like enzyme